VLFMLSMWLLSRMTPVHRRADLFWPLICAAWGWADLRAAHRSGDGELRSISSRRARACSTSRASSALARHRHHGHAALPTTTAASGAVIGEHVSSYDPETTTRVEMLTRGLIAKGANAVAAKAASARHSRPADPGPGEPCYCSSRRLYLVSGIGPALRAAAAAGLAHGARPHGRGAGILGGPARNNQPPASRLSSLPATAPPSTAPSSRRRSRARRS
jgi:hypothetical protein